MQKLETIALGISRFAVKFLVRPFLSALVEEEVVKQLMQRRDTAKETDKTKLEIQYSALSKQDITEILQSKFSKDFFELQQEVHLLKERCAVLKEYSVSQQKELLQLKEENGKLRLYVSEKLTLVAQQVQYLYNAIRGKSSIASYEAKLPKQISPKETKTDTLEWK